MSRRTTYFFKALTALITWMLLAGCSSLSPYSDVTKLNLKLTASDQLNPDLNGRPSPIVVRLFELKHPVAFENADFFSLYERVKETLATDLVATEELELRPRSWNCVREKPSTSSSASRALAATSECSPLTVTSRIPSGTTPFKSPRHRSPTLT